MKGKARRGARRLAMQEVRAALVDGRVWTGLGVVRHLDGDTSHYEVDADMGVLVSVELMPGKEPLLCRLGGLGSGGTQGVWRIPPVGTEVVVCIPSGELDDDPCIVATLASGGTPSYLDATTLVVSAPRVVIVADSEVIVNNGTGGVSLGLQASVAALESAFNAHTHILTLSAGTGTAAVPANAVTASTGTVVLKGK